MFFQKKFVEIREEKIVVAYNESVGTSSFDSNNIHKTIRKIALHYCFYSLDHLVDLPGMMSREKLMKYFMKRPWFKLKMCDPDDENFSGSWSESDVEYCEVVYDLLGITISKTLKS